jgi:hypothetical protein
MSTWILRKLSAFLGLILTDDNKKVMVGADEDKILVWNLPTQWTFNTKHTSVFTNKTKH